MQTIYANNESRYAITSPSTLSIERLLKPSHPSPHASSSSSSKPAQAKSTGQLRIIGGQWRGRKLSFPAVEGLRPTGDRVRETLFNWLSQELQGARCLDVFAGSGALGVEALSRGAEAVTMLERDARAAAQLRANLGVLNAENGRVIHTDAFSFLQQPNPQEPYHVVFIDPPFQLQLWQQTIAALETGNWLASTASIYIEAGRESVYHPPANWQLHREKFAGQVNYRLYYRDGESRTQG
jgi:16S rRNA (guanine966-N2)-methyltransferase